MRLDRRGRVIDQPKRRLTRHRATPKQQRHHQPGGGRADRGSQQMFGVPGQGGVGLAGRIKGQPAAAHENFERIARTFGAEVERHRRLQFARRRRRAPKPKARRARCRFRSDKGRRLQALDRARLTRQRQ